MAMLSRYVIKLTAILNNPVYADKKICHWTGSHAYLRANAAYLIAAYMVVKLDKTPSEAVAPLQGIQPPLVRIFLWLLTNSSIYMVAPFYDGPRRGTVTLQVLAAQHLFLQCPPALRRSVPPPSRLLSEMRRTTTCVRTS